MEAAEAWASDQYNKASRVHEEAAKAHFLQMRKMYERRKRETVHAEETEPRGNAH
jgi:hypothetical protein